SLVGEGFVSRTPPDQLVHLPRYLRADVVRIGKAEENPARDDRLAWQVRELTDAWWAATTAAEHAPLARRNNLARVRWLIEELRVSLFAQQLGTAVTVSAKRIRKALAQAYAAGFPSRAPHSAPRPWFCGEFVDPELRTQRSSTISADRGSASRPLSCRIDGSTLGVCPRSRSMCQTRCTTSCAVGSARSRSSHNARSPRRSK